MEWVDEGVVLGARRHGETSAIAELFTLAHGRHLGIVRGGRSRRQQVVLQPGNGVRVTWRARLEEHLGNYAVEPGTARAARLMDSAQGLYGLAVATALVRLLPERDPHPRLYGRFIDLLGNLPDRTAGPATLARFELDILAELGFGLDLAACAATGTRDDLIYVSPRSGRAVCREAGEPYAARLLALPAFLHEDCAGDVPSCRDVLEGFRLTGYFLALHVFEPRRIPMPPERDRILDALSAAHAQTAKPSAPA